MEARRVSEGRMRKDPRSRVGLPNGSSAASTIHDTLLQSSCTERSPSSCPSAILGSQMKSRLALAFVVFLSLVASASVRAQEIAAAPTRTSGIYDVGEKIDWKVDVKGGKDVTQLAYIVKKNMLTVV